MANFKMVQEFNGKAYFLPLPEYGYEVVIKGNQLIDETSKLGKALLKYYGENVQYEGETKSLMEKIASGDIGGSGTSLTTEQTDALEKIEGLQASASGIDLSICKTRKVKIAFLGDSITAAAIPISSGYRSRGYISWLMAITKQNFDITGIFGYSGFKTAQIYGQISNVINSNPDVCIVMAGTNDIKDITDISLVTDTYDLIINELVTNNIKPVFISVVPINDATYDNNLRAIEFNKYLKAKSDLGIIDFISTIDRLMTNETTFNTLKTYDGTHPNSIGAYSIALEVATYLDRLFKISNVIKNDELSTNYYPAKLLSGTGGTFTSGATGVAPDGLGIQKYGTDSVVTSSIGLINNNYSKKAIILECSSTQPDGIVKIVESVSLLSAGTYYLEATIEVEKTFPLISFSVSAQSFSAPTFSSSSLAYIDTTTANCVIDLEDNFTEFVCRTPNFTLLESQTFIAYIECFFGNGSGKFKVYNPRIIKVTA